MSSETRLLPAKGGIDFNPDKMNLETKKDPSALPQDDIRFHIGPAMLRKLQSALGFTPVIINIQPMDNLRIFLGITETSGNLRGAV